MLFNFDTYEMYNIINIPDNIESKKNFIIELLNYNYKICNYKYEKYYELFYFIVNYINENIELHTDEIDTIIFKSNIINRITMLNKGQNILKLFKPRVEKIINKELIIELLILASNHGTILTFIFGLNIGKYNINDFNNILKVLYWHFLQDFQKYFWHLPLLSVCLPKYYNSSKTNLYSNVHP